MRIQVKAHIRAGRKVKAYVRGGGGASRSAQYRKASLSGISSEAVKKFYNPLKKLPRNPLQPTNRRRSSLTPDALKSPHARFMRTKS